MDMGAKDSRLIKDPKERRLFYNANKKDMIADLRVMGNKAFLAKWPVSTRTISHLKVDPLWLQPQMMTKTLPELSQNGLPPLPPFDKSWDISVQLKWFDVWSSKK